MIFKGVQDGKPYADHGFAPRDWAKIPPRQIRLDELITVTSVLALDKLLSEDSTFYGDLFAHAVQFHGDLYLEDGLHRAVRSALRGKNIIHARVLNLDEYLATGIKPGDTGQSPVSPAQAIRDAAGPATGPVQPGAPAAPASAAPAPAARPVNPRRTGRRSSGGGAHRA
ncbi:MAG: type II toxin-antitoxin system VapB family antitoxin [Gordonia sp. (in: high G+C Gram-positive bacteria)]|uniref:type II toxin-antitoxin system VapB family antitoxin n=1 Tax=Gordonia sp. (in: high G+C Gram-positive bacteria) TaxID=84139 RepID=UPI0039E69110